MPKGEQKYILNKLQSKIYQGDIHLFPVTAKNCASIMYMYELLYVVVLHACMHACIMLGWGQGPARFG